MLFLARSAVGSLFPYYTSINIFFYSTCDLRWPSAHSLWVIFTHGGHTQSGQKAGPMPSYAYFRLCSGYYLQDTQIKECGDSIQVVQVSQGIFISIQSALVLTTVNFSSFMIWCLKDNFTIEWAPFNNMLMFNFGPSNKTVGYLHKCITTKKAGYFWLKPKNFASFDSIIYEPSKYLTNIQVTLNHNHLISSYGPKFLQALQSIWCHIETPLPSHLKALDHTICCSQTDASYLQETKFQTWSTCLDCQDETICAWIERVWCLPLHLSLKGHHSKKIPSWFVQYLQSGSRLWVYGKS